MLRRTLGTLFAIALAAGCSGDGGAGPHRAGAPVSVVVISGDAQVDSIDATLTLPVVAEARDANGIAVAGVNLTFRALHDHPPVGLIRMTPGQTLPASSISATTDEQGRASAKVRFGTVPGATILEVRIAGTAGDDLRSDTATFVIKPGNAARLAFNVRDTAVVRGRTAQIYAVATDRLGNLAPETPVAIRIFGDQAEVSGTEFRALDYGRVTLQASAGSATVDQIDVAIVPAGRFVVGWRTADAMQVFLLNSDLSDRKMLAGPSSTEFARRLPDWSPSGDRIAMQIGVHTTRLFVADTFGNVERLLDPSLGRQEMAPVFSPSGEWIFFTMETAYANGQIWRSRPDGQDAGRIGPDAAEYEFDYHASPSPDGSKLVFQSARQGAVQLVVLDVASGDTMQLSAAIGTHATWSPRGDWIAYWWENRLYRIRPDGTGNERIGRLDGSYSDYLAWSPDGKWLVLRENEGYIEYFNVDTNVLVLVPSTRGWGDVAWRPTG